MARVVVVGGGILGSMHALIAHGRGHEVVHIEREPAARGASVRNFGLIWVSGRAPGAELALASRARDLWARVAERVPGVGFRVGGSLTVARDDTEMEVLAHAVELPDSESRGFRLLDPAEVRVVNPAVRGAVSGALWARRDALVEPRKAARALVDHLRGSDGYRWLPGREVVAAGDHAVTDASGVTHEGDLVVVCTGASHNGFTARAFDESPVRRVRVQMMETEPLLERLTTSLADIDSLRYYPAYATLPLERLPGQPDIAAQHAMQLLLAQRLDGSLTIGDTHAYEEPLGFDLDEAPYEHLTRRTEEILGCRLPPVRARWAGVYSQVTDDRLYCRGPVADGVTVVTGVGGRGMTCAPAIAEETLQ